MSPTYEDLLAHLMRVGALDSDWIPAFRAAPRADYLPRRATAEHPAGDLELIDSSIDPMRWADVACMDVPLVTATDADGTPISSCSMPYMVATMLRHLDVQPGQRVLEIGTGTGWNAALLSARLGGEHITTIEVDPDVLGPARRRLARLTRPPLTILGDGAAGAPEHGLYDRLVATCAVHTIPPAWVAQTRGIIVAPWRMPTSAGCLLRLHSDGRIASGRVVDTSSFMWLRAQAPVYDPDTHGPEDTSVTLLDPRELLCHDARFAIGLRLPGSVLLWGVRGSGREAEECTVHLQDAQGSWAWVDYKPGRDHFDVGQHGPRRLWDEAVDAYAWWLKRDCPDVTRYGLTVTVDGHHTVWLDDPGSGETWSLTPHP